MTELRVILNLIDDIVPGVHQESLEEIIELNRGKMKDMMKFIDRDRDLFSHRELQELMEKESEWKSGSDENKRRMRILKFMIAFRGKEHIEMLNFSTFREMLSIDSLKVLFTRQNFVNFTIQEKQMNTLLHIQGYFLKNFIFFHMRHDMRFKATIDSTMIDLDNPYTRHTIRDENRADRILGPKYIESLDIEKFSITLLDKFFPDIAGIWADHTHNAPYYILEFIKIGFEYGFFKLESSLILLDKLKKITANLIKLEEGWLDKLNEVNKFSDMIKASNITNLFAKCRENMAYILVHIIILHSDMAFIDKYPKFVKFKAERMERAKKQGVQMKSQELESDIIEEFRRGFCFNNRDINDAILFITMNYLSNTVYISMQKSMNPLSREAVEKIFLYITSHNRDTFLNSLKQIKLEDLRYFEEKDVVSEEVRNNCDDLGYSMRKLLELIGMGEFDKITGALNKELIRDPDFEKYLKEYVPSDNPTLPSIIKRLLSKIDDGMRKDDDFKVALVKESIPLQLISMVDYISEYFVVGKQVQSINKEILSKLNSICAGNNYSKSQLFKGDSLFHLKRLLYRYDKDIFLFINNLCIEDNIGFYLGKDIFTEFVKIYKKFNSEICQHLDLENPAQNLNVEDCTVLLLMTKIITKLFKKPFLDDREKLQYALIAQETIQPKLEEVYFPQLLTLLQDQKLQSMSSDQEISLNKNIFKDNSESELINTLEKKSHSTENKKIVLLQVCFNVLKAFNVISSDCFSSLVMKSMHKFVQPIKDYISSSKIRGKRSIEPFGLDAELLNFIKIFDILPEQGCLLECAVKLDNSSRNHFTGYMQFVSDCIDRVADYNYNSSMKMEAQIYLFQGLFPLIFKIVNSVKDLTNFDKPQHVQANLDMVKEIMSKLNPQIKHFNSITDDDGKEVVPEGYLSVNKDSLSKDKPARRNSVSGSQVFKDAKAKASDSVSSRQIMLVNLCGTIVEFFEKYFEKAEEEFQAVFKSEQDITSEDFEKLVLAAKFEGKTTDQNLVKKYEILNLYIKIYYKAKEDYFERPEEPNLMSYFDRNNQNLRGVFNSCLDRLLNRKKPERKVTKVITIAEEYGVTNFWFNPACYAYINMLTRLLTKSKTARKEFYSFLREDRLAEEALQNPNISKQEKEQQTKSLAEMAKLINGRRRDNIVGVLLRIHTDLLIYLNSNASLKPLWWVTHQTYEMISMFFKNLCECNFIEFKVFLGECIPETSDEGWSELENNSVTEVFMKQLIYLMTNSRISKNKEPHMVHTDQIDKMHAIMGPLINLINETITGPCTINQRILMGWQVTEQPLHPHPSNSAIMKLASEKKSAHNHPQSPIEGLINMSMRIIDDLSSIYADLAQSSLTLLLSMCEGYEKEVLKAMAARIPSSILVDRLTRFTKKIYIKELILLKRFENMAIDKLTSEMDKEKHLAEIEPNITGKEGDAVPTPQSRVANVMKYQDLEKEEFYITEEMETMIEIEDWKDLFDMYMKRPDFSDSQQFHYIFNVMILWRTLSVFSRSHQSRIEDVKYEADELFKEKNLFDLSNLNLGKLKLKNKEQEEEEKKKAKPSEFVSIFYFISNKIMSEIEVVDPNSKPLKVYFPKAPPCYMLSEEAKNNYREDCQITDSNTKMLDLMRNYRLFEILMNYDLRTWRAIGFGFKFLSADAFKGYTFFCWLVGLILNFVVAAGVIMDDYGEKLKYRNPNFEIAIVALGYILMAISALFLFVWLLFKYRQTFLTRKEDYLFDHPGVDGSKFRVNLYVMLIPSFFAQAFPMNYTLHILFCVLGNQVSFLFYAFNLILITNISKTAKFVLTSIYLHIDQLVLTLVLAFFAIFSYSVFLGNNLNTMISDSPTACNNLVECFFFTANLGLRNGGGIAESLTAINIRTKMAERTIFDITFFMLINVISLNIVFGIIIDTFSQLRDDQNYRGSTT
jgi:hypothetical protein